MVFQILSIALHPASSISLIFAERLLALIKLYFLLCLLKKQEAFLVTKPITYSTIPPKQLIKANSTFPARISLTVSGSIATVIHRYFVTFSYYIIPVD